MKIDIKSLLLGAFLVFAGYIMGAFGTGHLIAQSFPSTIDVDVRTPGYLDVKLYGDIGVNGYISTD